MRRGRKPASPAGRVPKDKLAEAIGPIAEDYVAFVNSHPEGEQPGDSKAFRARHDAGLVALHHLTELTSLLAGDATAEAVQSGVDKVLADTRARMAKEEDGDATTG
ncbi:hypothetical protein [Falsiroseomonas sp. CW058]|uniref:hypothetical protein n=1 Tax=Falsiroseomonas sp. CW058 TaxID=3388664 RepID=UPI003D324256